jgi:transcriptional regulator with XRE-family HTH domain
MLGTWQDDVALAEAVGIASSGITDYKARDEAPPAKRTLALAKAIGVDPGWLAFGDESAAPVPQGFTEWLARRYPGGKVAPSPSVLEPPPIPAERPSTKKKDRSA